MIPEKGRNAYTALRRELDGEPLEAAWLREVIDERGKRAAKTGAGYEDVREQVAFVNDIPPTGAHSSWGSGTTAG